MPLLAGSASFTSNSVTLYYTPWLQAFVNAINQLTEYPNLPDTSGTPTATIDLSPIGFENWRLYAQPPSGLNIISPNGRFLNIPAVDMNTLYNFISSNPTGANAKYAKCLIACDSAMDSMLVTFYTKTSSANVSDRAADSAIGTSTFFLARDLEGDIFAGSGGPSQSHSIGTITRIMGSDGIIWLNGNTDSDTGDGVLSCNTGVYTNTLSLVSPNKWLILSKMPNYTKTTIPLAKSMMIGLAIPRKPDDATSFNTYYRVNGQIYANFSRYSQRGRIPFIDPWCPT